MEKLREEAGWRAAVCLNGQLEIQLPEGFEVPSNDVVERTFPYGQKPQEIYADSTGEKIITFNVLQMRWKKGRSTLPSERCRG